MTLTSACGILAALCATVPVAAQAVPGKNPVVYKIEAQQGGQLGTSIVVLGDVNGDGVKDFAASKRHNAGPKANPGEVNLYSGKDGSILRTWIGEHDLDFLGDDCLAAMPDLDGDGIPELGASAAFQGIYVYSPVTGKKWYTINTFADGRSNNDPGRYFLRVPDMDGDGIEEFVAGAPDADLGNDEIARGRIALHSGRTGSSLWVRWGSYTHYGNFGGSLLLSGDHNGDGVRDILSAERLPNSDSKADFESPGVVRVISGRTGELLHTYEAPAPNDFWFGDRMVSLGDRDGNGFPEIAISAPTYRRDPLPHDFRGGDSADGQNRGWVGVFSLPDFTLLFSLTGRDARMGSFGGDWLGLTLATAGDVNRDGITDLLIGTWRTFVPDAFPYGRLYLCSGSDGTVLEVYEGLQAFDRFFERLSPLDDIDGDGRPEFLAAHPSDSYLSEDSDVPRGGAGSIFVLRYDPDLSTYIRGDANGDGQVNLTDAVAILRYAKLDFCSHLDPPPEPRPSCLSAYDIDADGCVSRFDALKLIRHFFLPYEPAPVSPFPECSRFLRIEPLARFPDLGCKEPRPCGRGDDK